MWADLKYALEDISNKWPETIEKQWPETMTSWEFCQLHSVYATCLNSKVSESEVYAQKDAQNLALIKPVFQYFQIG